MWDRLSQADIPAYDVPEGWAFPIFSIGNGGDAVVRLQPKGKRVRLEEFEVSALSRQSAILEVCEKIRAVCEFAGFAGTALVAVRTDYTIVEPVRAHVLQVAVMFTAELELELGEGPPVPDVPDSIDMGPDEPHLHKMVQIAAVMWP